MGRTSLSDWRGLHGDCFESIPVLLTGGAGFIGSHLAEALVDLGAQVTVLDDLSGGSTENLASISPVEFVQGSILDMPLLSRVTRGKRFVFHLAALGSVPASVEHPRQYHDVDATGTLNVLEAAREAKVQRLLYSASSSAYGNNPVPWTESMPVRPCSPYAAAKQYGESLLRAYSNSYGLDTAALRYFNIFGPRQNANSAYAAVIAAFAKAILAGKQPTIFGDGLQSRDFTFVHNAVHANLLAARCGGAIKGEVINVGTGSQITVNDLAVMIARFYDRPDLKPIYQPERPGDLKYSYADLALARAVLDYSPIVAFSSGLEVTLAWYRTVLT